MNFMEPQMGYGQGSYGPPGNDPSVTGSGAHGSSERDQS